MTPIIRVLMIDDDEAFCKLTRRYLNDVDGVSFEFDWVTSAAEGLKILVRGEHDVYLVDYKIGPADGLELVRTAVARGSDAAIVMLTCHGSRELDLRAMEAGAELFLEKGRMDPTLLERSIRLVIERHGLRRSLADRARLLEAANDELRRVGLKLRKSKQRLKAFTEALPDLATVFDDGGRCLEVLTRHPKTDLLKGRCLNELLPADIARECVHGIRLALETGVTQTFEFPFVQHGRTLWLEARASTMEDDPGEGRCVACVLRDVTRRKRTEQELERSNEELQQFAYVASHDLREPLRMIAGYTSLLEKRLAGCLDEECGRFMSYVLQGVDRMHCLIDDLLAYSRVGTPECQATITSSQSALDRALENLRPAIEETGATIRWGELPAVRVDLGLLTQLFQNLVGNAIKFRNDRSPLIEIGASDENDSWRFSIRDNGIGLEERYAKRIFVIFQRLHSRDKYPGSGIGLAICQRIVERHGGTIDVESEPARGSTFYFTLPKATDEDAARNDQADGGE